ncbi:MAG: hypothetical protein R3A51_10670 [Nannocystaceae bacterium]
MSSGRARRRRILRGTARATAVRVVALLQVALALGLERARPARAAAPPPTAAVPLPSSEALGAWYLDTSRTTRAEPKVRRLLAHALYDDANPPSLAEIEAAFHGRLPGKLAAVILARLDPLAARPSAGSGDHELLAALDEAEQSGLFDPWIPALLWGQIAKLPEPKAADARARRRELLARLRRHALLCDALTRAAFEIGPVEFSPWRSKAARPIVDTERAYGFALQMGLAQHLARPDATTWATSATIELRVISAVGLTIARDGAPAAVSAGAKLRIGRLDLLETAATSQAILEHPTLGRLPLPQGRSLSVWQLPELLQGRARELAEDKVQRALAGDPSAAAWIEATLPLTHALLRAGLRKDPRGRGAPTLRMILALFDDAVVRARQYKR